MNRSKAAQHIHITGIVQGVGFRPFVYSQAEHFGLAGWVRNTSSGVDIVVEGDDSSLSLFIDALKNNHPTLAHIDTLEVVDVPVNALAGFEIIPSQPVAGAFQPISPDISICPDCLRELFDPYDRRYRYPFINCTNCGPRFTIIEDIPYDRPKTTMSTFDLCLDCAEEYSDPANRRFHAQPIACKVCGPKVWIENSGSEAVLVEEEAAISEGIHRLAAGQILAVKGLGGFHLACDALNPTAVVELRRRKMRVDKPFAVMMPDMETVKTHCIVSQAESHLLTSKERPIVILERRSGSTIAAAVAPRQNTIGVMLPYTPLHYLLFSSNAPLQALVMTSGNLSEEPIAVTNEEARQRLSPLADAFLMHNRPIRTRCDDSVVREHPAAAKQVYPLRRSRGYSPYPVRLNKAYPPVLAVGAELKNTFCLMRDQYAFMSHHIGDLQNYETLASFQDGIDHFQRLFRIKPEILAYDLHPDYLSTRVAFNIAEKKNIPAIGVQHHHAHIAACMVENNLPLDEPVIGIALDGTGYGLDEAIWGGEFLLATCRQFERKYHLGYMPLPGGDAATRNPARIALAYLWQAGLDWDPGLPCVDHFCAEDRTLLRAQLEHQINTPLTSSAGRLFDAISALAGVNLRSNYEAQAAIELEALVDPMDSSSYPIEFDPNDDSIALDWLLTAVVNDVLNGVASGVVASRFHNTFAGLLREVVMTMRSLYNTNIVALSGGVWQNTTLLSKFIHSLDGCGVQIFTHSIVPTNDGGLALGQAVVAAHSSQNSQF